MSKKILAGVLVVTSMLSLSVAASAGDAPDTTTPITGVNKGAYTITAGITEGEVNVELPNALAVAGGVFLNPYKTAVKSEINSVPLKNTAGVASKVFEIKNLDTTDPIKVVATVSVTKATNVVVKDYADNGSTFKNIDAAPGTVAVAASYNPLIDYTAISLNTDKTYKSGGDVAAAQKKNIGIYLVGGTASNAIVADAVTYAGNDANVSKLAFLPKGTKTGDIVPKIMGSQSGYFAVRGDVNPKYEGEWDTVKDSVALSVIIKCMPTT